MNMHKMDKKRSEPTLESLGSDLIILQKEVNNIKRIISVHDKIKVSNFNSRSRRTLINDNQFLRTENRRVRRENSRLRGNL